jgi:hypothetical protein
VSWRRLWLLAWACWIVPVFVALQVTEGWVESIAVLAAEIGGATHALLRSRVDLLRDQPFSWSCPVCTMRVRTTEPTTIATIIDRHKETHA